MLELWLAHSITTAQQVSSASAELWVLQGRPKATRDPCSDCSPSWQRRASDGPPAVSLSTLATDQDVQQRLEQLTHLQPGWNGRGGVVPTQAAIDDARSFYALLPSTSREPTVEPSGDGEINFVWRAGGDYLEIGFDGDGALSYYGEVGGREVLNDLPGIPAALPRELRIALSAFPHERA